jgi:hypothetical protein
MIDARRCPEAARTDRPALQGRGCGTDSGRANGLVSLALPRPARLRLIWSPVSSAVLRGLGAGWLGWWPGWRERPGRCRRLTALRLIWWLVS